MYEYFRFDGRNGRDFGTLLPAELTGKHRPFKSHFRRGDSASRRVKRHLGGSVQHQFRRGGMDIARKTRVLHDHGVNAERARLSGQLPRGGPFVVAHEDIGGEMHLNARSVAVLHRLAQLRKAGKILRVAAGIESARAEVNRVRAGTHGSDKLLTRTGGSENFYFVLPGRNHLSSSSERRRRTPCNSRRRRSISRLASSASRQARSLSSI